MGQLITNVPNLDSLARAIRSGNACIPVTHLSGDENFVPHPYFGSLVVEGDGCEIRLRSMDESTVVHQFRSFFTPDYFERRFDTLQCVLDGHLAVTLKQVQIHFPEVSATSGVSARVDFNELAIEGGDKIGGVATDVRMVYTVARTELRHKNLTSRTTTVCSLEGESHRPWMAVALGGDIHPYRYKITQENDDVTLQVQLLEDTESQSAEADRRFMSALLLSFVWLNGGHPYPYARSHYRAGELIECALQHLIRNPRSKARLIHPREGVRSAAAIMESSVRFFSAETPFSKDLRRFLWQYREATSEDPITLGMLLQSCSLLEGIIGLTLRYPMNLDRFAIDKLTMPGQLNKGGGTAEARFFHASTHLGFDWSREFGPVFECWKEVRNALAHGDLAGFERRSGSKVIDTYLRVIQAFNAATLRMVGYTGRVCLDDDRYAVRD